MVKYLNNDKNKIELQLVDIMTNYKDIQKFDKSKVALDVKKRK